MTAKHAFSSKVEKEFWRINKKNSIVVNRSKLLRLMGLPIMEGKNLTTDQCRLWIRAVGIKPHEFIVKKANYDQFPTRQSMGFGEDIEFRFTEEAYLFVKLSGIFDEIQ